MKKKITQVPYLVLSFILTTSCFSDNNKNTTKDKVVYKYDLFNLLQQSNAVDKRLVAGSITNVDSINGFRGLNFDFDINNLKIDNTKDIFIKKPDYSQLNYGFIDQYPILLKDSNLKKLKIEFINNKLRRIELKFIDNINKDEYCRDLTRSRKKFDFNSYPLIETYINSFGIQKINGKYIGDQDPYEEIQNNYKGPKFSWETSKIFYELEIIDLNSDDQKSSLVNSFPIPNSIKKEGSNFFEIQIKITIYEKKYFNMLEKLKNKYEKIELDKIEKINNDLTNSRKLNDIQNL